MVIGRLVESMASSLKGACHQAGRNGRVGGYTPAVEGPLEGWVEDDDRGTRRSRPMPLDSAACRGDASRLAVGTAGTDTSFV